VTKTNSTGRVYAGLKKDERISLRRQKFIDAGIEVFGTRGFRAATVRVLCAEAGLTARYYYESFESTEELLTAAFEQCMERIGRHITRAVMDSDMRAQPQEIIVRILDAFFSEMEDKRVTRLIMLEVLGVSESVDKISNQRLLELGTLLIGLARNLYPRWQIETEAGTLLSVTVLGAMRQAAIHWMVSDYTMPREEVVRTTSMLVLGWLKVVEEQQDQDAP